MFSSNKWNKKEGAPSSFWRKRQLISLNSSVFIENLPSFERARARARANHAKIDAQKGCAMQLNGITLKRRRNTEEINRGAEIIVTVSEVFSQRTDRICESTKQLNR